MMNQLSRGRIGGRGCIFPLLILVLLLLGWFVLRGCFASNDAQTPGTTEDGGFLGGILGGAGEAPATAGNNTDAGLPDLNRIVSAVGTDANGCATNVTNEFYADEPIYIVVPQSLIPQGTELFARLSDENGPIEDAAPIVADRDLNTCAHFVFQDRNGFATGNYHAELIVNGQPADRIDFTVSAPAAAAGGAPAGIPDGMERVVATYDLNSDGCAVQGADTFRPDETIYLSAGPAFIPAGTEVRARLLRSGRAVEDASPITAQDDLDTCVYFAFEPSPSFDAGVYTGELYVDGALAGSADFEVR